MRRGVLSIVPVLTNAQSYFWMWSQYFSEQKPHVSSILYDFLSLLEANGMNLTNSYRVWYENCLMWVLMENLHETYQEREHILRQHCYFVYWACVYGVDGAGTSGPNAMPRTLATLTDMGGDRISFLPLNAHMNFLLVRYYQEGGECSPTVYTVESPSNPIKAVIRIKWIFQVKRELSCPSKNSLCKSRPGLVVPRSRMGRGK